jgi:preprotein translocase subunit SecF
VRRDVRSNDWLPATKISTVQPDWSKRLGRFGVLAAVLAVLSLGLGIGFEHQWVPLSLFGVFGVAALVQNIYFFRARNRGRRNG